MMENRCLTENVEEASVYFYVFLLLTDHNSWYEDQYQLRASPRNQLIITQGLSAS